MNKTCKCGSTTAICPECGKTFDHGTMSACDRDSCIAVNAPLDCAKCGHVVCSDLKGVLDFDMNLIPYN